MQKRLRKLFDKAFSRYVSTGFIFALDVFLSFLSALLVLSGAHYLKAAPGNPTFDWVFLVTTPALSALMFWIFKSYRIIIRHSSLSDIFRFGVAVLLATLLEAVRLMYTVAWPVMPDNSKRTFELLNCPEIRPRQKRFFRNGHSIGEPYIAFMRKAKTEKAKKD